MRRELAVHPGERPAAGLRVEAAAVREAGGGLALSFAVRGPVGGLRLPGRAAAPARADGLWRTTCFEAFVAAGATDEPCYLESGTIETGTGNVSTPTSPRPSPPRGGGEGGTRDSGRERWGGSRIHESRPYVEINLAPSGDWQAYAFDGYRAGRRPAAPQAAGRSGEGDFSHRSVALPSRHPRAGGGPGQATGPAERLLHLVPALFLLVIARPTGPATGRPEDRLHPGDPDLPPTGCPGLAAGHDEGRVRSVRINPPETLDCRFASPSVPRLRGNDGQQPIVRPIALPFPAPAVETETGADAFTLSATLDLSGLRELDAALSWRIALAAVIEDAAGGLSHWALAHPPGRPDVHHAAGFALTLPPPAEEGQAS